jgi:hypothetical protein
MSLLAKNNIGLIILSALLIFSCKEKENIGLQLPEDNVGAFFTDTLSLTTEVNIKNDDIVSSNQSYLYAGAYHDPEFGDISASAFTQLILKDESKAGTYTAIDSVVMTLSYDYYYGDTTENQTINAYELSGALDKNTTYYSNTSAPTTNATLLDQDVAFKSYPVKLQKQKIRLTDAFGIRLLNAVGTGTTNAAFVENVKGIALIPKQINEGAILRIKLYDNTSSIKVYFKNSTPAKDSLEFLMNTSGARFSRVVSNNVPSLNTSGTVYLESLLGVRTKITFPTLENFKNKLGSIAINRAELILKLDNDIIKPAPLVKYDPVGLTYLIKLDNSGNVKKFTDTDGSLKDDIVQRDFFDVKGHTAPLSVVYDSTSKSYTYNVSSYLHAMLYGIEENNGLIIAPHSLVSSTSLNRTLAGNVKMRIYYTKVD